MSLISRRRAIAFAVRALTRLQALTASVGICWAFPSAWKE